jgi:uncharacterized protein with PQ loop repeat
MISPAFATFMMILPVLSNSFIYVQAYKLWFRRSHDDVSFLATIASITNTTIWGYYGWLIHSIPLMISGVLAFVGFSIILALKLTLPSKDSKWQFV